MKEEISHAYYTILYNQMYYTFYNYFDNYPEELGQNLVNNIQKNDIKKWAMIKIYEVSNEKNSENFISDKRPENNEYIKWIYIINLDENKFEIETEKIHIEYNINNIPSNWVSQVYISYWMINKKTNRKIKMTIADNFDKIKP